VAIGLFSAGGVAVGLLALGGVAVGFVAVGGVAVGLVAVGAVAMGLTAVGALTVGLVGAGPRPPVGSATRRESVAEGSRPGIQVAGPKRRWSPNCKGLRR
jgi:hypothetical protein